MKHLLGPPTGGWIMKCSKTAASAAPPLFRLETGWYDDAASSK
jgi:hypothetical protein